MSVSVGVQLERCQALSDVQELTEEYGETVKFYDREEADVSRDSYNSIKSRSISRAYIEMKASPVTFNPSAEQVEKAGLREKTEVMIYTPMKSWIENSLTFEAIDMVRTSVVLREQKYLIKDKGLYGQISDTFTHITFGLSKV